jgi:hypothetical protein
MGIFQRFGNWLNGTGAKIYNGIRHGVSTGYNAVSNVAHKIGSVADGIDNALTQIKSIPVIGQVASTLQNSPIYQEARGLIKSGVGTVDQVGDLGKSIAQPLDNVITSTVFKGNPNITPL